MEKTIENFDNRFTSLVSIDSDDGLHFALMGGKKVIYIIDQKEDVKKYINDLTDTFVQKCEEKSKGGNSSITTQNGLSTSDWLTSVPLDDIRQIADELKLSLEGK